MQAHYSLITSSGASLLTQTYITFHVVCCAEVSPSTDALSICQTKALTSKQNHYIDLKMMDGLGRGRLMMCKV